ncbi:MAG: 6-phospho-beta-glucosidase [Chloroflexota bacterium]
MRIAVIGGGSTYTPELVQGFLDRRDRLPLRELWLVDLSEDRLAVVGALAQRMVAASGAPFRVVLTTDRRAAIAGASYVITQLRVGQMAARRADEELGRRHGLVGQETTGIGGFAKALRTIPVVLEIARDIRELAPDALLVNFTNPAGLVTEALFRHAPEVRAVGVCNGPIHLHMDVLEALAGGGAPIDHARGELDTLGLNHLGWYRGFRLDGRDVWPEVMERWIARMRATPHPQWDPRLLEALGMIPNSYLQYFYATADRVAEQATTPTRAEVVQRIEAGLLRDYADPTRSTPPDGLLERGGAYYSTVATQLIAAHHDDLGETHIVNVRHDGAVPGWDPSWVLELPARVGRSGIVPLPTEPLPAVASGLLHHVKSYELLTVEAAVTGDRETAFRALVAHPLGPSMHAAGVVLDDLLAVNRAHLPRFGGPA